MPLVPSAAWSQSVPAAKVKAEDDAAREAVTSAEARYAETRDLVEEQVRNAGVHAAGVVIGAEPLVNLLPLKQDDDGGIVTQYAMGPVGKLGLLKMDFLGLKTLTVIRNTCEMVQQTQGIAIPIDDLPLDDERRSASA